MKYFGKRVVLGAVLLLGLGISVAGCEPDRDYRDDDRYRYGRYEHYDYGRYDRDDLRYRSDRDWDQARDRDGDRD